MASSKLEDIGRNFERQVLKQALEMCGTQTSLARLLGVDHTRITKLVAEYGLCDRKPSNLALTHAVVTKTGFLVGMLQTTNAGIQIDGVDCPELPKWLESGKVLLVAGKSAADLLNQGVQLQGVGV